MSNSVVVYAQNGNQGTQTVRSTRRPADEAWRGAGGRLALPLPGDGTELNGARPNNHGHSGPGN